jgi:cytochrome c-type biogenesis protein CcmH/NrfG
LKQRVSECLVKGQSGNPDCKSKELLAIRALAQQHSATAFSTLAKFCKNAKSETARIHAANSILDRAFGRPPQAHTSEGGEEPVLASITVKFVKPGDNGSG